jgi:hypothetical protein
MTELETHRVGQLVSVHGEVLRRLSGIRESLGRSWSVTGSPGRSTALSPGTGPGPCRPLRWIFGRRGRHRPRPGVAVGRSATASGRYRGGPGPAGTRRHPGRPPRPRARRATPTEVIEAGGRRGRDGTGQRAGLRRGRRRRPSPDDTQVVPAAETKPRSWRRRRPPRSWPAGGDHRVHGRRRRPPRRGGTGFPRVRVRVRARARARVRARARAEPEPEPESEPESEPEPAPAVRPALGFPSRPKRR